MKNKHQRILKFALLGLSLGLGSQAYACPLPGEIKANLQTIRHSEMVNDWTVCHAKWSEWNVLQGDVTVSASNYPLSPKVFSNFQAVCVFDLTDEKGWVTHLGLCQ